MNGETAKRIDGIEDYINKHAFASSANFRRNLTIMKENLDLDWYNIALIACSSVNPCTRVLSIQGWEDMLKGTGVLSDSNISITPVQNCTIYILKPELVKEKMEWSVQEVFPQQGVKQNDKRIDVFIDNPVVHLLKTFDLDGKRIYLKEGWNEALMETYLNTYEFYRISTRETKLFYRSILMMVYGKELFLEKRKLHFVLDQRIEDKMAFYQRIHEVITGFYVFLKNWCISLDRLVKDDLCLQCLKDRNLQMLKKILATAGEDDADQL